MLKHLYSLSLALFFVLADQCHKANYDEDSCNDFEYECESFEPATFESVPNSCEFFPQFEIEVNPGDFFGVHAFSPSKWQCEGYVNDCCGKSLAKKESCRLPSPPPGITYHIILSQVNKSACMKPIPITRPGHDENVPQQHYINIERGDMKYCYFELPAGINHVALKNMTSDSNRLVEINPGWKYNKKRKLHQHCPEFLTTDIELTTINLSDSEELNCVEFKTDDTSLELLMKQRTIAADSARCLYIHSNKGFVCLPPDLPTSSHVHNVLVILLPLMGFIAGASIIIISCYRHTIKKKFCWFFCLENKFDVKLDEILYVGNDEGGIAHKFLPDADIEEPIKIEFVSNHSDTSLGLLCNDSTAEQSYNETSRVINMEHEMILEDNHEIDEEDAYVQQEDIQLVINMEQEMIPEDKHEIDEENAYVQQEDIQQLMIRLNHGEDGNNGKVSDIIHSKDIANLPANFPEDQHTSCRTTLDSGIGSTGSEEGTSYSQTNKADFSVGVLSEEYDCCFDEQEMIPEDKYKIDEENAYVQQEDIQQLMIRLNHGEDGNNRKESDIIHSKDIANHPANLPEDQHTSCRTTLDSGIGSTGSEEGTSYSQTNKADFSVGVLGEEYDCCFDEDPDIVLHDGYVDSETFARY